MQLKCIIARGKSACKFPNLQQIETIPYPFYFRRMGSLGRKNQVKGRVKQAEIVCKSLSQFLAITSCYFLILLFYFSKLHS